MTLGCCCNASSQASLREREAAELRAERQRFRTQQATLRAQLQREQAARLTAEVSRWTAHTQQPPLTGAFLLDGCWLAAGSFVARSDVWCGWSCVPDHVIYLAPTSCLRGEPCVLRKPWRRGGTPPR
eukprot:COSAG01_NODE_1655_length_9606_cov_29.510361_1_plen_127_part_00